MADLSTSYMGLVLKNPVIVGSCGLTSSVAKIKELERAGAAAVVLKSLFEEEILLETGKSLDLAKKDSLLYTGYSETLDYMDLHIKDDTLKKYLNLIRDCKKEVLIPVIASINCTSNSEWVSFAKKIEEAGADGLEINLFINPLDHSIRDIEETSIGIVKNVLNGIRIPVSVKIGQYFTRPVEFISAIADTGVRSVVLFNRFYVPDIDIEKMAVKEAEILSTPAEFSQVLRWVGIFSGKVKCSIAASTGVHDGVSAIKMLLAGADAVQVVSAIYKHGPDRIGEILSEIEKWMDHQGFSSVSQFIGKLSLTEGDDPAAYERMQFMKYFGGIR